VGAILEQQLGFETFYRTERDSILRAVLFTLDDRDLAMDSVDEAMSRAYERWNDVATLANPPGWVYRVAVNVARNRVRRRLLERRKPMPAPDTVGSDAFDDPAIARALTRLPIDQRAVVVLRFYLDWSVDDVAVALDVAPGTVKSRLHRGLRRLESSLKERR
jgi:RNA polymerase sigma-70 factor (ECF subfamily)